MPNPPTERTVIARVDAPQGEMQLQTRAGEDGAPVYEIIANGVFLMASYNQVSERALAQEALTRWGQASGRALIGGLGMGFTLQETLRHEVRGVDVVEISQMLIAWNRRYFAGLNGDALKDPRVRLIHDDLYAVMQSVEPATYDVIMLDVDNGPSWLAFEDNGRFYTMAGLKRWLELLTAGGILGVWSAQAEPAFLERLQAVFPHAEERVVIAPDPQRGSVEQFIYLGQRAA